MQRIIGVSLLIICSNISAKELSVSETDCLKRNIYHEMRSESKQKWHNVAKVALNRKKQWTREQNFGSVSSHLCDIIKSKEYRSKAILPIKEPKIYQEISAEVDRIIQQKISGDRHLFFTKHGNLK